MHNLQVQKIVYNKCRKMSYPAPAIAKVEPSSFNSKELICEVLWQLRTVEKKGEISLYIVVHKITSA